MQVYNNVPAFGVWTNYTQNVASMRSSMEKMSSGLRINSPGDDPAGLAISERMRTQIRNSSMAAQNIQNKLGYIQTADSWLQKIHDILGRMGELSVAANDGTKTDDDRANLQEEFQQMQQEIARITTGDTAAGKYNTAPLFERGVLSIQIGPDAGQLFCSASLQLGRTSTVEIGSTNVYWSCGGQAVGIRAIGDAQVVTWGSVLGRANAITGNGGISVSTQAMAQRAGAFVNLAIDHISRQRAIMGAEASRLSHTLEGLRTYEENIRSAESQIRDVDMARESTEFAKYQILTQVGTAMLAQANALPQNVLQLIG
jgi:flagellin